MPTIDHKSLDERVSSLEASVAALTVTVDRFVETTANELSGIRAAIQGFGRTNWGTLIAAAGLIVVLIGGVAAAYLAPAVVRMEYIQRDLDRQSIANADTHRGMIGNRERVSEQQIQVAKITSALQDRLAEIETQFGWLGDAVNQDRAHRVRMEGLIWHQVFGEPLPLLHINPIGPTKQRREP